MKKYLSALWGIVFLLLLVNFAEHDAEKVEITQTEKKGENEEIEEVEEIKPKRNGFYPGSDGYLEQIFSEQDKQALLQVSSMEEEEIYSFLQGPKSWKEKISWSGEWCKFGVEGNPFGGFGCGLCCLANIYDTLTPYEVSPWDMYEYAILVTDYRPSGKAGAIDWKPMKKVLNYCGFSCNIYRKSKTYEEFREEMAQMKSAIVLVSSNNDSTFWRDTPGHYVNIWMYQEEDDTVFLAEPGNPENNRKRIPLRYVYDALKTKSKFQYLVVEDYLEEQNQWKADGIDERWNPPAK